MIPWVALAAVPGARVTAPAPSNDPEFLRITGAVTVNNHEESCARMHAWVEAHPGHPDAGRGLVWISKLRRADGRDELARTALERVLRESPDSPWALDAIQGLADLDRKEHHYERALAGYEKLARSSNPMFNYIGHYSALYTRGERDRFYLLVGIVVVLAGLSGFRLWRAGGLRALWPPPAELVYPLPILLLMLGGSTALEVPEGHTVVTIALGGVVLLWLNGAYLRARRPEGAGRVAQAMLGVLQACALLYCAVVFNGLWEKLVDTIAMGAE